MDWLRAPVIWSGKQNSSARDYSSNRATYEMCMTSGTCAPRGRAGRRRPIKMTGRLIQFDRPRAPVVHGRLVLAGVNDSVVSRWPLALLAQ